MKEFFGEDYLLQGESAKKIYSAIKDLPIIDYHCHLDDKAIKEDKTFSDIGELWLSGDHYKWRVMRLCGVSEDYITGYKSIIFIYPIFIRVRNIVFFHRLHGHGNLRSTNEFVAA